MKLAAIVGIFMSITIQDLFCAIVNTNTDSSEPGVASSESSLLNETTTEGWSAEDMPDPRYCPSCCGINEPGWMCDPDGVLLNRAFGGGKDAADRLNTDLWKVVNNSACPCATGDCYTWNAVILVAVVKKLKNPEGKPVDKLIGDFAKELQERWWKADDTDCQQEIIIAMSLDDKVVTTEIGDDVLRSKMMTYHDVYIVGGISKSSFASYELYSHVKFLIITYEHFLNHPPLSTASTTTRPARLNEPTRTLNETVTVAIQETTQSGAHTLSPGIIAFIVIGVLMFLGIIGIFLVLPCICKAKKSCFEPNK